MIKKQRAALTVGFTYGCASAKFSLAYHKRLLTFTYVYQTTNGYIYPYIRLMETGYKIRNPYGLFYLTFTVVDWVDIFSRKVYRDILISSMDYCRKQKLLSIWAYVIMTNHMHCILSAKNGNLPSLIRDFKRFTATQIIKSIETVNESRSDWMLKRFEFASRKNARNSDHQFWLHDNHPMELTSQKFINQKLDYIHNNPVKAGWIEDPSDWMYSSQRNYSNLFSLLEIDLLDVSPKLHYLTK